MVVLFLSSSFFTNIKKQKKDVVAFVADKASLEELKKMSCQNETDEDFCEKMMAFIEETLSADELVELYLKCLKKEEDNFFNRYTSRVLRNPHMCDTLTPRNAIIEKLFLDSFHSQKHWLENMLRILQRETNESILDTIISNMSETYYPVFRTIYMALISKENMLISKDIKEMRGIPDPRIEELKKLRKSMVARIDGNAFDYQKKICLCLETETRLEVTQRIIVRIGKSQIKNGFTIPANNWITIEGINKNYKDYNLTEKSVLKKVMVAVLKKRDELRNRAKIEAMNKLDSQP